RLPFARLSRGVHTRSGAADAVVVDPLVVDRAGVRRGHLLSRSPAVEDLHLIQALKVDAGVGGLGDHEFEIQLDVAEASLGTQIGGLAGGAVENDAARRGASGELRRPEDALVADEASGVPLVLHAGIT